MLVVVSEEMNASSLHGKKSIPSCTARSNGLFMQLDLHEASSQPFIAISFLSYFRFWLSEMEIRRMNTDRINIE